MTGHYYGQVEGDYIGGTGRFEGSTGTATPRFEGQNLGDPNIGFRSITGTVERTVGGLKWKREAIILNITPRLIVPTSL
jgi:hypothetical protein